MLGHCARENPLLMPEEFTFQYALGQRGAIELHKRGIVPGLHPCTHLANISLPIPLSPVMITVAGEAATRSACSNRRRTSALWVTIRADHRAERNKKQRGAKPISYLNHPNPHAEGSTWISSFISKRMKYPFMDTPNQKKRVKIISAKKYVAWNLN